MYINPATSAINLISTSQQKANDAAQAVASLSVKKEEVGGSSDFGADELFKPVMSMKEAELETKAAVKLLQADDKMKQNLLDIFA